MSNSCFLTDFFILAFDLRGSSVQHQVKCAFEPLLKWIHFFNLDSSALLHIHHAAFHGFHCNTRVCLVSHSSPSEYYPAIIRSLSSPAWSKFKYRRVINYRCRVFIMWVLLLKRDPFFTNVLTVKSNYHILFQSGNVGSAYYFISRIYYFNFDAYLMFFVIVFCGCNCCIY